ncbi:hypothetical protein HD597_002341 [Nonomuraea thailandensis]|uniref:Uncharacterized protein n=1 Tax=Nonomuraea thailandensis TaxID=1188745 RepID=A0A9X2GH68_9ACTN|nr:hypothetical protein [Nonomuraea thailandensis]MCP2355321.1 hypothetical protein [Nonomuraea thailandensis]
MPEEQPHRPQQETPEQQREREEEERRKGAPVGCLLMAGLMSLAAVAPILRVITT